MRRRKRHIHIMGGSGCGVSTLGRALAKSFAWRSIDVDDYYWDGSPPPFAQKRPVHERIRLIQEQMQMSKGWVLSGSISSWGNALVPSFDLVIFLTVPTPVRIERLRRREHEQFGKAIEIGGNMYENHKKFIAWAEGYDTGGMEMRSRKSHEHWLSGLSCPVLRIDGLPDLAESLAQASIAIDL